MSVFTSGSSFGAGCVLAITLFGCSSDGSSNPGAAGSAGMGAGGGGAGGQGGGAGSSVAGMGGAGTSAVGGGGSGGAAGAAGSGGSGGATTDILSVKKSTGCGKAAGQATGEFVRHTIATSGTKDADATGNSGAWSYEREYFVWLPEGYDNNKAYPLVLQGPGCGGDGTGVYSLSNSVDNTVIRVGLTPPPNSINHEVAPNSGCFDDKEGDDSVEWPFYEGLIDELKETLCYDENRVFVSGNSSGAWLGNELGCKYAGDTNGYAIRGIAVNTGGLPTEPQYLPTCSNKPMAGMWVHETGDPANPFNGTKVAVKRAMTVNGCTIGTDYDSAEFDNFPIGGGKPDSTCKKIKGCPAEYPLVVCELPGNEHRPHDDVTNPGFATFIKAFSMAPLIKQ